MVCAFLNYSNMRDISDEYFHVTFCRGSCGAHTLFLIFSAGELVVHACCQPPTPNAFQSLCFSASRLSFKSQKAVYPWASITRKCESSGCGMEITLKQWGWKSRGKWPSLLVLWWDNAEALSTVFRGSLQWGYAQLPTKAISSISHTFLVFFPSLFHSLSLTAISWAYLLNKLPAPKSWPQALLLGNTSEDTT